MVNKIKGEVALEHDGATYRMRLDFNALAEFESALGDGADALSIMQRRMTAREMRALFWAGLRQCHPDMAMETAGRILTSNIDRLEEALASAFPDGGEGNAAAG